jgi:hypothetical protein
VEGRETDKQGEVQEAGSVSQSIATSTDGDVVVPGAQFNSSTHAQILQKQVKPFPPLDFSGDCAQGRAFLNSCKIYLHLASHQFDCDTTKVAWALSFMKTGHAALFMDRVLHEEACGAGAKFCDLDEGAFCMPIQLRKLPRSHNRYALRSSCKPPILAKFTEPMD